MLGTELKFSTAYHPQSDGQSERTNRTLEEYLRHFVSPRQDDWDEYLDLAEFAINDSVNPSTGYTPFFMAYGQNPHTALDLTTEAMVPRAQDFAQEIADTVAHAKIKLEEAHMRQAEQANKHRRKVTFQVGDKVRLSTTNLQLPSTMSKKLVAKYIGPFTVEKVVSPVAYKLKLPKSLRIHPVFHVTHAFSSPGTRIPSSPPTRTPSSFIHPQWCPRMTNTWLRLYWISVSPEARWNISFDGRVMALRMICGDLLHPISSKVSLMTTKPATMVSYLLPGAVPARLSAAAGSNQP